VHRFAEANAEYEQRMLGIDAAVESVLMEHASRGAVSPVSDALGVLLVPGLGPGDDEPP
jgi:hypothetical protein